MMSAGTNLQPQILPYVEVVEQPAQNMHRFRYQCESRSVGCIVGVNSSAERKTYPSIRVQGYEGPSVIIISCVTKDDIPKAHPHGLVGKAFCENGVCSMKVNLDGGVVSLSNLGIQCVKKKQVREALKIKKENWIDPFNTGFEHMNFPESIDLNAVRLAFQVFIPGPDRRCRVPLRTVVTVPIYDKKSFPELVLFTMSHDKAPVSGGMEIILLCDKVSKHDIQVRLFEVRDNLLFWDAYGEFKTEDVHKQVAIAFKTPRYCNQDISEPVNVHVQLRRKSDGATSNTFPFQMMPLNLNDVNSHNNKNIDKIDKIDSLKRKRMEFSDSNLLKELKMQKHDTDSIKPNFQGCTDCNIPLNQQQHSKRDDVVFPGPRLLLSQPNPQPRPQPRPQARPQPKPQHHRIETPPPNVIMNSYAYREPTFTNYRQEEPRQTERNFPKQETQLESNLDDAFDLDGDIDKVNSQDLAFLDSINSDIFETLSENLSTGLSISNQIEETHQSILELNKDLQARQQQQQKQHAVQFFGNNERDFNASGSCNALIPRQTFGTLGTETVTQYFK